MRIADVVVGNYRSIGKQTHFLLSDLTTLIGPNNEGKSNLLRSLALGLRAIESWGTITPDLARTGELTGIRVGLIYNSHRPGHRANRHRDVNYQWTHDYPLAKQAAKSPQPTLIRITFHLSDDEVSEFKKKTGLANNGTLPVELKFGRSKTSLQVVKPGRGAAGYSNKAPEIAKFISEHLEYVIVPAVRTLEQAMELLNDLATLRLSDLAITEEYMLALQRVDELRKSAVESVKSDLMGTISTYLSNVQSVDLQTRDIRTAETIDRVVIDDGSPTTLTQKGDGVKSLFALALIQHLARERISSSNKHLVLLVDEPEAHLHSRAVHDLLALFSKIAREQQVVLATHNPIFVNRESVESNILVRGNAAIAAKNVRSVRETLGVELQDNLDSAEVVVITEGLTDEKILPAILKFLSTRAGADVNSGRVVFKAAKGTGKLANLVKKERSTACKILVVVDGDQAGEAGARTLHEEGILDKKNIFVLRVENRIVSEIEDLIDPKVYLAALEAEFGRSFSESHFAVHSRRWSDNFKAAAKTLGMLEPDRATVDLAKVAVSNAVELSPTQSLKPSGASVIEALSKAIWG